MKSNIKNTINALVMTVMVLAAVFFIQAISVKNEKLWDVTKNQRYTLSDTTQKALKDLDSELEFICFVKQSDEELENLKDLLKQYTNATPNISVRFVDPERNNALAKKYSITAFGTIVAKYKDKTQTFSTVNEETVTNAILKLIQGKARTVYFLAGHGEKKLDDTDKNGFSSIAQALKIENYQPQTLVLLRQEKMPEDAAAVVVAGQQTDISESEFAILENYINNGGRVLFLIDPQTANTTCEFLDKNYGVVFSDNIIVDQMSRMFGSDYLAPVVTAYPNHAITKDFALATVFPLVRTVDFLDKLPEGIEAEAIAGTGPGSWAETDIAKLFDQQSADFSQTDDRPGPVPIAAALEINKSNDKGEKTQGRVVIVGDSDFAGNSAFAISGNKDFFLNIIKWLCKDEKLISIGSKQTPLQPLILKHTQALAILLTAVVAVPLAVILVGIFIFMRRKKLNNRS